MYFSIKKFSLFVLLCVFSLVMNAQTLVLDKEEDFPVAFASVFNQDGKFLGQTDTEGLLPPIFDSKSIKVTHIAYEPLKVETSKIGKELKMTPVQLMLGEAVIAKPKAHCIRLTGFLRNYALTNQLFEDDDPIIRFYEGTGQLYIFLDGKKSPDWCDLAARDSQKEEMVKEQKRVHLGLRAKSIIETINKSSKVSLNHDDGYDQIVRNDTIIGTVVKDDDDKTIRADIDYLFPDTMRLLNLVIVKLRVTSYKENYIYRMNEEDFVSQGDLRAYQSYKHYWTKAFGMRIEGDQFDDFYVDKAEFLTKDEYKAAMKEYKQRKKNKEYDITSEELDEYIKSHNIPEIPEELRNALEISKQIQAKKETPKK